MRKTTRGRLAAGIALTGVVFWMATSVEARSVVVPVSDSECVVTGNLDTIPVQAEPVAVQFRHTEPVGDSIAIAFPQESGVAVLSVGREPDDEPNTARASLNTSAAVAGSYAVTLSGTAGECAGTVTIGAKPAGH